MATAQVLFQRFWFVSSLRQFGIRVSPSAWSQLKTRADHVFHILIEARTSVWAHCT